MTMRLLNMRIIVGIEKKSNKKMKELNNYERRIVCMSKMESVKKWSKKNRKKIVVAGIATASVAGLLVGLSHRNTIQDTIMKVATKCDHNSACDIGIDAGKNIASNVHSGGSYQNTFGVMEHIRNLPAGWHASQEKINKANELGIELMDNQTFVDAYMKGAKAA